MKNRKYRDMSIGKPEADSICYLCNTKVAEEALKCKSCSSYTHFRCSELPNYHLVRLYIHRSSTYSCRACVGNESRFVEAEARVKKVVDLERNLIVDVTANSQQIVVNSGNDNEMSTENQNANLDIHDVDQDTELIGGQGQRGSASNEGNTDRQEQSESASNENNTNAITRPQNRGNQRSAVEEICQLFLQKKCPKGKSGRVNGRCPKKHPKICYRFINFGTRRDGCNRGAGCKYYHPKICHQFEKKGNCNRTDCTFYHAKKRLQKYQRPSNINENIQVYGARAGESMPVRENIDRNSYAGVAGSRSNMQQIRTPGRFGSTSVEEQRTSCLNQSSDFLEVQTQMQQQIKQLSQLMQVLVSRETCKTNTNPTRQQMCLCGNPS